MKTSFHLHTSGIQGRRAFTLIEMMVVVAMIALIVAAVAPMVFGTLIATRLTSAGETLAGQLSLAHQLAMSRNTTVEVRFYQYDDPEIPGSKALYRAVAIMRASKIGANSSVLNEQLTDTYYLPSGIAIGDTTAMSPLLTNNKIRFESDSEKIIKRSKNARYKSFQINPDGTTNLELLMDGKYQPQLSYVTLAEDRVIENETSVPKNFYAVQIDPATGRTTTYRP